MSTLIETGSIDRFRVLKDALSSFSLVTGSVIVLGIVLVALFGYSWAPFNPYLVDRIVVPHYDFETEEYIRVPINPGEDYVLGTNDIGMDMLSLLLHGARNTLVAVVLIAAARILLGLFLGLAAGWFEGSLIDRLVMGAAGVLTSLPMLISGMILIFALGIGGGLFTFFVALSLVGWTEVAQYIRGEVLIARKMPYMEAARSIGLREIEIAIRHVIPNILPQLFVIAFLEVGAVLMLLGELALIGVFIGGGASLDFSDIMSPPSIAAIPSQPEWGAMIAMGFRWFRSNPHIVLVPASAVFVAVLGFNALGEGLRELFEKRGIKTSFIVSKRMLLLIALLFFGTAAIFQSTQPVRWFQDLAGSFQHSKLQAFEEELEKARDESFDLGETPPQAVYMAEQLREYGVNGGVRWSNYFQVRQNLLYEENWMPQLRIFSERRGTLLSYEFGEDFSYILKAYGGSGDVSGEIVLLRVWPSLHPFASNALSVDEVEGKIVLLIEGNAPYDMGPAIANGGAAGVVWIASENGGLEPDSLEWLPRSEEEANRRIPVFRLSHEAGLALLTNEGLTMEELLEAPEDLAEDEIEIELLGLASSAEMQISLVNPKRVETTNVVAYIQGTDADLGDEAIVFVARCDGLWRSEEPIEIGMEVGEEQCMVPLMLEFAHMLEDIVIDRKRPIVFLIYGGGEFGDVGFNEWLRDRDRNYAHFSAPGMRLQPRPAIILQFVEDQNVDGLAVADFSRDDELLEVLDEAGEWASIRTDKVDQAFAMPMWIPGEFIPYHAQIRADFSGEGGQQIGESLSLALVRMLREAILNGD